MQVEFWGSEFKKRKNSTKVPDTDGVIKEVVIKSNFGFENQFQSTKCSIVAPSFFVTGASGYGYCKVWDNYYWITNISFDIDGAEYIDCKIDVLASWANLIKESTFYIDRCADPTYFNTDIFDESISIESGGEVSSSAKTSIFDTGAGGSWLITVLGTGTTGLNVYAFSGPPPASVFCPLFDMDVSGGNTFLDAITGVPEAIVAICKTLLCDPSRYIVGLKYSPLPTSAYGGGGDRVFVGWFDSNVTAVQVPSAVEHQTFGLNKPSSIYSDFRKTDPRCSMYNIYLPGVGTVDLSPDVMDLSLSLRRSLDYQSGGVHYNLMAGGATIGTYDGGIYADSGYGGASINTGAVAQTAGGIGSAYFGSAKKDWVSHDNGISAEWEIVDEAKPLMFYGGVIAAIHGAGEAIKPQASLASPIGSRASVKGDPEVIISCVQKHTGEFLTNDYGRPCCKNLKIGDLSGFVRCANASIEIASTDAIRNEINAFLNTGFFVE